MTELVHGYKLADLHEMARYAVHLGGDWGTSWRDRYDLAYGAIAEALYAAETRPTRNDLLTAGRNALYEAIGEHRQAYGYYRAHTDGVAHGLGSSPAFRTFWLDWTASHAISFEDAVCDRISLGQILPLLPEHELRALYALAALEDYPAAAAALGVPYQTYKSRLARARNRFRWWWHQGEVPSRQWGVDRRAGVRAGTRRKTGGARTVKAIRRRTRMAAHA